MTGHDQTGSSLSAKLNSLAAAASTAACRIGEIHSQLDKETGEALIRALQSGAPTLSIHRAIREEGFALSRDTVTTHRKCFQKPTDTQCLCFPNNTGA